MQDKKLLTRFGTFLKKARDAAKLKSQAKAAEAAQKFGATLSQSLVAQYEAGKIADPDPLILQALAKAYNIDYMELVFELVKEKYEPMDEWTHSGPLAERWHLCDAAIKSPETVGGVDGLREQQLRAKAALVRHFEVLDLSGMIEWQISFHKRHKLVELWLVLPGQYLDDVDPTIKRVTVAHIKDGVRLRYFVDEHEMKAGERFALLKKKLAAEDREVTDKVVDKYVTGVSLSEEQRKWINTGLVIANPGLTGASVGFRIIRHSKECTVAIRLAKLELEKLVDLMGPGLVIEKNVSKKVASARSTKQKETHAGSKKRSTRLKAV